MITRATQWMSGRWWATLAVALAFVLVARTGTVGAPAEARTDLGDRRGARPPGGTTLAAPEVPAIRVAGSWNEPPALRIVELEDQLRDVRSALWMERERSGLLQASHDRLAADLERLGDRVRAVVGADAAPFPETCVPTPIEALFVRELPR